MKPKRWPLHTSMAAIGAGALIMSVWLRTYFPTWRWHQEPLHSAMEAIGGLAAIAMGAALLQRADATALRFPVACGFLGMGVLELFHAVSEPGDAFVFLRSMASLAGGIGFGLIWLSGATSPDRPYAVGWAVVAAALALGIWALWFPHRIPLMIRNEGFTLTAVAPQGIACVLFLASAVRFSSSYRRAGNAEDALFASLAFLFALAEAMFVYSTLWDSRWWFWHGIRLTAYLLVLGSMVQGYRQMLIDLQGALAQTTQAEESARLSKEQLRHAVDMRERMSQDLHDGIIQSLFALGLNLERCQRLVTKAPNEAVDQLALSAGGIKAIIRDLRGYIAGHEPTMKDGRDLASLLESLAGTIQASAGLRCRIDVDPAAAARMTAEQAQHILYIVREAVSNSIRHAKAQHEAVSLQLYGEGVRLIVEDDGSGFDRGLVEGRGEGLKNMAARAKRLGARFEIRSESGQGTKLIFDIALRPTHV
ncbi:MAG TPA: ATP-binding protein [Nitrospiraceae bacterium]|nr:ATP-binding protein [Nitrospiraceae bacterium]